MGFGAALNLSANLLGQALIVRKHKHRTAAITLSPIGKNILIVGRVHVEPTFKR
jgi:hypothetical protein